ncbi:MAG: transcription antitermination factor NusB [Patescibacteria group bacterium]
MSNRHLARTIALQTLFAWDFNGQKDGDIERLIVDNFANFAPNFDDGGFVKSLVCGVRDNLDTINKYIIKYATEWPLDQITTIDRNILRLGIYELLYTAIPPRVAINEAIEVAKSFGSDASGKFVNGVLGALYNDEPEIQTRDNKEEVEAGKKEAAEVNAAAAVESDSKNAPELSSKINADA